MSWHHQQWESLGVGTIGALLTMASAGMLGPEAAAALGATGGAAGVGAAGADTAAGMAAAGAPAALAASSGLGADAAGGAAMSPWLSSMLGDTAKIAAVSGAKGAMTPNQTFTSPGQGMQGMTPPSQGQQPSAQLPQQPPVSFLPTPDNNQDILRHLQSMGFA